MFFILYLIFTYLLNNVLNYLFILLFNNLILILDYNSLHSFYLCCYIFGKCLFLLRIIGCKMLISEIMQTVI